MYPSSVKRKMCSTTAGKVSDMQVALQKVVDDEELIEDLKISEYFSVVLNESTDRSTEKTLMIYVRYLKTQL